MAYPFWLDPHVRPPFVSSFIHIFIHETMVGKPATQISTKIIQHRSHMIRKSHQISSGLKPPKLTPQDPQVIQNRQKIIPKSPPNLVPHLPDLCENRGTSPQIITKHNM